jgi:hypothetical protein
MKDKSQAEKTAAERQVELLSTGVGQCAISKRILVERIG